MTAAVSAVVVADLIAAVIARGIAVVMVAVIANGIAIVIAVGWVSLSGLLVTLSRFRVF